MYVCQLSKAKQLTLYKAIKAQLIELGVFSYENISNAMNSKVSDLPYEIQEKEYKNLPYMW